MSQPNQRKAPTEAPKAEDSKPEAEAPKPEAEAPKAEAEAPKVEESATAPRVIERDNLYISINGKPQKLAKGSIVHLTPAQIKRWGGGTSEPKKVERSARDLEKEINRLNAELKKAKAEEGEDS